jgi:hypothetical protein
MASGMAKLIWQQRRLSPAAYIKRATSAAVALKGSSYRK